MDEFELSERCKQRDNRARKELYERYGGRMLTICMRYVSDRNAAQDLLHDGFLQIFNAFDKFTWRGEGSLRAWMERVTANVALQHLRKNDVIRQSVSIDETQEKYEEPQLSDVDTISSKILLQFIAELPEGYRTVFNLYCLENKSHKEIARLLNINEKSSASQLFRAKSALAKKIKDWMAHHN